jgi:hypothetical protein
MNQENTVIPGDGNVAVSPDHKATALSAPSGCVRVTLPISENGLGLLRTLMRGMCYCDEARAMGGKARSLRSSDSLIIEHTGLTRDHSKILIDRLTFYSYAQTLKVAVEERESSEFDLESPGILPGEFAWRKFNKGLLFELPHYAIVVAMWRSKTWKPTFLAQLEPGTDRSKIWSRAVNSGAAHRPCAIYWRADDIINIYNLRDWLYRNKDLSPPPFRL